MIWLILNIKTVYESASFDDASGDTIKPISDLREALDNYDGYNVSGFFANVKSNTNRYDELTTYLYSEFGWRSDNLSEKITGIRGISFSVGSELFSFQINGLDLKKRNYTSYDELCEEILGPELPADILDQLYKIPAKELLETGDGELFDIIRSNWRKLDSDYSYMLDDAVVNLFKTKVQELYGRFGYNMQSLTATIDDDGNKVFRVDNLGDVKFGE